MGKGLLGMGAGAAIGGVVCSCLLGGPFQLVGALCGAAVAGLGSVAYEAYRATRDRMRVEWVQTPIVERSLAGYRHEVTEKFHDERHLSGKCWVSNFYHVGWNHEFTPDLKDRQVGSYWKPVVVHYRA